jgi:hypothetical protein
MEEDRTSDSETGFQYRDGDESAQTERYPL